MFTMVANNTRKAVSAVCAVAVVSFSALALDQGHVAAAPRGSVEIGELSPIYTTLARATLPEVVVVAKRVTVAGPMLATLPEVVVRGQRTDANPGLLAALPEIVVTGRKVSALVAQSDRQDAASSLQAGATGASVLLK